MIYGKEKGQWEMEIQERIEADHSHYVSEEGRFRDYDEKVVKSLRVSCWLNVVACGLKLNDHKNAIILCSKVLDVEFYNVKALYRRAQDYMETYDYELTEVDIKKALEADPQNREVKSIHNILKQLEPESNKRDATLHTNMFA
ncbi:peptidyl-prolyl cis-trans isomerase FKBP62 isoform X1 [Lactuca sativa]|uniref:peptidyl-prolyl cis-trans isomerase FKBP62 isoform X1 n=2 Tax=Lactuca sativa TaxID=4236 RepID=UPI001C689B8A|nr:peptidyl-prolyl cis-trans isomerase FKBP62 isoform X1 [Lactuca sativa]